MLTRIQKQNFHNFLFEKDNKERVRSHVRSFLRCKLQWMENRQYNDGNFKLLRLVKEIVVCAIESLPNEQFGFAETPMK